MSQLLVIEASPRGAYSVSRALTRSFVQKWQGANPGSTVVERDLAQTSLPFVDLAWIAGAFTPQEQHTDDMRAALQVGDTLIAELKAADHIVIGTPMYNFSVPAVLKAYIDHIVRLGVTFTMQYEGLLVGKKATIILSSGSDFSPGSAYESANLASSYLRQILGFIGIKDVNVVLAGKALAVDQGETTLDAFAEKHSEALATAIA